MEPIFILFIIIGSIIFLWLGFKIGQLTKDQEWVEKLPKIKQDSLDRSKSVVKGQVSEQLAPFLPDFPFNSSECKFLGKPIDLLVFKGMDDNNINEVIFVEVKTGKSTLSSQERKLRDVIKEKRVKWQEYRI
ncbi:hypothetical protein HOC50_02210 [archaeon]|nr:hypothetical protein [archaeon]MBT4272393.1 hypothetical protein [archaeon]MBT4460698.1 hypothetical protein [archaeon]MBT5423527.1 hypothetical protein [archaeon]MBT6772807.1 hypothetical protein [archaeon]